MRSTIFIAVLAAVLPSVSAHPTTSPSSIFTRQGRLPTCGAAKCIDHPTWYECPLWDLECLCGLDEKLVQSYVNLVQPCIDNLKGRSKCTPGARLIYKQLLSDVCALEEYGAKAIVWPGGLDVEPSPPEPSPAEPSPPLEGGDEN